MSLASQFEPVELSIYLKHRFLCPVTILFSSENMTSHGFIDRLGEEDRYDEDQRPMPTSRNPQSLPEPKFLISVMNRSQPSRKRPSKDHASKLHEIHHNGHYGSIVWYCGESKTIGIFKRLLNSSLSIEDN